MGEGFGGGFVAEGAGFEFEEDYCGVSRGKPEGCEGWGFCRFLVGAEREGGKWRGN